MPSRTESEKIRCYLTDALVMKYVYETGSLDIPKNKITLDVMIASTKPSAEEMETLYQNLRNKHDVTPLELTRYKFDHPQIVKEGDFLQCLVPREANRDPMCPGCRDNSDTMTSSCGHTLCETCYKNVKDCPMCRAHIVKIDKREEDFAEFARASYALAVKWADRSTRAHQTVQAFQRFEAVTGFRLVP